MLNPLRLDIDPLTTNPIAIGLIRDHCHVDEQPGTYTDDLLYSYMKAAIYWAEGEMHRTIISRSHRWVLREFPCGEYQEILLPRGKVQSVESIAYVTGGVTTTLTGASASPPGTDFQQDLNSNDAGVLMPARGASWPSVDSDVIAPVIITFTAGWSAANVPQDILHALLFYVSDAYELRGTTDIDSGRFVDVRESKISGYRLHRWY